jgi:phosphatidylinositol alpha-1,6-mannosyltransferase
MVTSCRSGGGQSPPLKVLVLTSTFPRWPADVEPGFVFELCRRLVPRCQVRVLAPHFPGAKFEEEMGGVSVTRFRYWIPRWETLAYVGGILNRIRENHWRILQLPLFIIAQAWTARRLIRQLNIQVLHAHWLIPQGLVALIACIGLRYPPKLLCTSHGGDWYAARGSIMKWLKLQILTHMHDITVVSNAIRDSMIAEGVKAEKIRVAPMGVDLQHRFVPQKAVVRQKNIILFVGRLVEKKGVVHLIDAFAGLAKSRPGLQLVIAGWGPEEARIREQVREKTLTDRVVFLGAVAQDQLPDWYSKAAFAVFPFVETTQGDQEGLGLVLVEALGCECPVIASDLPAVRDVIEPGRTGELVPPGNSMCLVEVMERMLDNPTNASRMARTGRFAVLHRFDWERVTVDYYETMRKINCSVDSHGG